MELLIVSYKVNAALQGRIRAALRPFGITQVEAEILLLLRKPMRPKDIAVALGIPETSTGIPLRNLETLGLIKRRRSHGNDLRATTVHITRAGRVAARDVRNALPALTGVVSAMKEVLRLLEEDVP